MRPMPLKLQDAEGVPTTMQQKPQQPQQASSTGGSGGAAFSPTRRVGARGGPQLFAQKLFTLVEEEDSEIVEWLPDGLAFRVKDIHRFSCEVLEKYFNHSKFTSFQRQLNLYQFKRRKGAHAGAFHHPSFRRGQRHLLSKVRRQKVKRDLAVEARAAQRLARAKSGGGGGDNAASQHGLSGRGRTRAAAQGDLRPIRRHRQIDDDDVSDDDEEFDPAPGSRRSALRRRVDSGPDRYAQDGGDIDGDESSNDGSWPNGNNPCGSGLERFSSGDDDDQLDWGESSNGDVNNNWRQQVPGSPERSPMELHHVSTPMTMTSQSEYEHSPNGGLGRTSSVGSSMASSLSFASSPSHSEIMFHSSSPYQLNDCDESGQSDCTSNQHSPMSIHSPVDQAVATVQAAANQVSPAQQQHSNDLSLAAVVDASINGWSSPHQSSSLLHLEQFGWGAANVAGDAAAPWSDPSNSGVPHHHQSSQSSPHSHEDFGFIDLFAANWDPSEGSSPSSSTSSGATTSCSPPSSSSSDNLNGGGRSVTADEDDAFLKEAQAAGVFGGVEDFLIPRSSIGATGGYGVPGDFA
ncbi:unnamed protein product [Hapterophycus canaliculatus]